MSKTLTADRWFFFPEPALREDERYARPGSKKPRTFEIAIEHVRAPYHVSGERLRAPAQLPIDSLARGAAIEYYRNSGGKGTTCEPIEGLEGRTAWPSQVPGRLLRIELILQPDKGPN
jgi:hypothetical protein